MSDDLNDTISKLVAEGADSRLALPSRANVVVHNGHSNRSIFVAVCISAAISFMATSCVVYAYFRDDLAIARAAKAARIDIRHIAPEEVVSRLAVDTTTSKILIAVVDPDPAKSSPFDDLDFALGRGSPLVDPGRLRALHDFVGWLSRRERPKETLDKILDAAMFFDDPRIRAILADARVGDISIDKIADILKYARLRPGVIDDMLAIAVVHNQDQVTMRWLATHPDSTGDPIRWFVAKAASEDPFVSRVLGAMIARNTALARLINSLSGDCSMRYWQACGGGNKIGK